VDPLDSTAIAAAVLQILSDWEGWQQKSTNGLKGAREHYSWEAHARRYLEIAKPIAEKTEPLVHRAPSARRGMLYHDRAIFSDLDQNLLGDPQALREFTELIRRNRKCVSFGIATGRRLDSALKLMRKNKIPQPDVLITSLGTEIHYAPNLTRDTAWRNHIDHLWNPKTVKRLLAELPGLKLQPKSEQSRFKLSYYIDPQIAPEKNEVVSYLHQHEQTANVIFSFGQYLDVIPVRASKGMALRWFTEQWDIPLSQILAAGGSGADEDMMRGNTLAVVVANRHEEELSELADIEAIYFASRPYAAGIMEAIDEYGFLDSCDIPDG